MLIKFCVLSGRHSLKATGEKWDCSIGLQKYKSRMITKALEVQAYIDWLTEVPGL